MLDDNVIYYINILTLSFITIERWVDPHAMEARLEALEVAGQRSPAHLDALKGSTTMLA